MSIKFSCVTLRHMSFRAERDHQRLQHVNRGTEKCHGIPPLFFT